METEFGHQRPMSCLSNGASTKIPKGQGLESLQADEPECVHVLSCWAPNSIGTEAPLLGVSSHACISSSAIDSYSLIAFVVKLVM